jgi:uncharacterized protein (DUF488 family)
VRIKGREKTGTRITLNGSVHHPATKKMFRLYTVGYSRYKIEELVQLLTAHQVNVLIDVRRIPWSRKPGFSGASLEQRLALAGIDYQHIPFLGPEVAARNYLRQTGDWAWFKATYLAQLRQVEPRLVEEFQALAGLRVCLLCLESDPRACHRSLLAGRIIALGLTDRVVHLQPGVGQFR